MPDKAVFNPGFGQCLIGFLPIYIEFQSQINATKNFSIKKAKYKLFNTKLNTALESTLGFWVGCILWGAVLKNSYKNNPQKIENNPFWGLKEEDISQYEFNLEFDFIKKYISSYTKDMKYFCGENAVFPDFYLKIVDNYQNFLKINNNFINTDTTDKINFPEELKHLNNLEVEELENLKKLINTALDKKNLSLLLSYYELLHKNIASQ